MELKDYTPLALVTVDRGTWQHDVEHAVLGMITEAAELADVEKRRMAYGKPIDRINVIEEVGDCLWYVNLLCTAVGYPLRPYQIRGCRDFFGEVSTLASTAAACAATLEVAGETLTWDQRVELLTLVEGYIGALGLIAERFDVTLEEAAGVNIAKLQKRYPDGFTAHAALNRNLGAERSVLESVS